jgi:hypothetical protein
MIGVAHVIGMNPMLAREEFRPVQRNNRRDDSDRRRFADPPEKFAPHQLVRQHRADDRILHRTPRILLRTPLWEGLYAPTRLALEPQINPLSHTRRTGLTRHTAGMRTMRRLQPAKFRGLAPLEIEQRTIGRSIGSNGTRTARNGTGRTNGTGGRIGWAHVDYGLEVTSGGESVFARRGLGSAGVSPAFSPSTNASAAA